MFQLDPTISDKFWETVIRTDRLEPEKRLMLAVLEDAVTYFRKPSRARRVKYREEEEAWFLSDDSDTPFSFVRICEALGLDAKSIRNKLLDGNGSLFEGTHSARAGTIVTELNKLTSNPSSPP